MGLRNVVDSGMGVAALSAAASSITRMQDLPRFLFVLSLVKLLGVPPNCSA